MGLNDTPSGERIHIGFFGCRNAGKSSVVNALTGQDLALVSEKKGTTTDPVSKAMELLPLGPVVVIDTPGYDDDERELGAMRVLRTKRILNKSDIAVLVVDASVGMNAYDQELVSLFKQKEIPYLLVMNKSDLVKPTGEGLAVSARTGEGIYELKEALGALTPKDSGGRLVGDLLKKDDLVILVTPIDESAPKGRMILPQVQMLRDVLDADAACLVVKETELAGALQGLKTPPRMVITDSQAFRTVAEIVPASVPLTSFSILMARYKGFLTEAIKGVRALKNLQDGDTVLIAEGCTHHRQCNDIGTVKIPGWIRAYAGCNVNIAACSGVKFPEDLSPYRLVLHCGGCMLNDRELRFRMKCAQDQNIPFTNYGTAIAAMQGILERSLELFPDLI